MSHAVTRYDRKQEEKANKKGGYYNHYALGHYLKAVDNIHADISKGMSHADAINNNTLGALARALHKALKTGDTDRDTKKKALFK